MTQIKLPGPDDFLYISNVADSVFDDPIVPASAPEFLRVPGTRPLIAALRHAGLVSLTHTPSPMEFLNQMLNVPTHTKPFMLFVLGYAAENAEVPVIKKKSLNGS